jgi:NAD(P)-dependent dehydrogenase (short-subunit alcohol dehydrogenase family)
MMGFEVRDKVALVTGGNRGIGRAILDALLEHGAAKVYAAVRNPASIGELAAQSSGRVVPVTLDLSRPETIVSAAETASDVQLVVNNAGVLRTASPLAPDAVEHLQYEMEVNVYGLIRMAQAFAPILQRNGGGAFVQLNSVASLRNFPDFATYCASKAAAYSITQGLRDLLTQQGTLVVSVHPGPIATDMASDAGLDEMAEPPSVVADALIAGLKSGHFHVFPDTMARNVWKAYQIFATAVVERSMSEA